jgi:hypothetical protein
MCESVRRGERKTKKIGRESVCESVIEGERKTKRRVRERV